MIIGDIIARNHWRYPDKTAIVFGNRKSTFKELIERVCKLSNALLELGLKKGDCVSFLLPYNMIQGQEIVFAVTTIGMVVVPINARFLSGEIKYLIKKCNVKALIFEEKYLGLIKTIRPELENVKHFICIGNSDLKGDDILDYEKLVFENSSNVPNIIVKREDIAALIHTSGTTGKPKEAIWTHESWMAGSKDVVTKFNITDKDKLLMIAPYFHIPFFWFNMAVFYVGGSVVLIKEPLPGNILRTIQSEKVTILSHFVQTTLSRFLNFGDLENYDLTSVRYYVYGGSAIQLLKRAISVLGNKLLQIYGFTEQSGVVAALMPEDHILDGTEKDKHRLLSCGKEMPGNDIRIVDKEGKFGEIGKEGELVVRGDNIMKGYWKEPYETKKVLKDGWFYTGDLGMIDEDRYIYIIGREKDMIKSGGENITPKEVEDIIYEHQ